MDENQTQNMNGEAQAAPTQPMDAQPMQNGSAQPMKAEYASFLGRFIAALIDAVLIGLTLGVLGGLLGGMLGDSAMAGVVNLLVQVLALGYYVYMTSQYGATLGKKVMGFRVQNQTTGQNLTLVEAFLREVIGKFLSGAVLLLGYLWVLWDPNNQAWHDKIAKSVVVRTK